MLLTQAQIRSLSIVSGDVPQGWRPTSYDATVGDIILGGEVVTKDCHVLPPRGVAWVVSAETFKLPDRVTGVATLRTTWTHRGVLALNVGIVDPNWSGSLATALVNLSNTPFTITKGDQFFRVVFHPHRPTGALPTGVPRTTYLSTIAEKSQLFARTFLDTDSLTSEIADKVLGFPRWALRLGVAAFVLSILAIFAPIAFSVWTEYRQLPARYDQLSKRVDDIGVEGINKRINDLERDLAVERALSLERKAPPQAKVVRQVIRQNAPPQVIVNANQIPPR